MSMAFRMIRTLKAGRPALDRWPPKINSLGLGRHDRKNFGNVAFVLADHRVGVGLMLLVKGHVSLNDIQVRCFERFRDRGWLGLAGAPDRVGNHRDRIEAGDSVFVGRRMVSLL